jgi:hypothetical protein
MKNQLVATVEPIKPIDPAIFKDSGWGQVIFFTLVGPIVLLCANEVWGLIKRRGLRTDRKHESELKSFEAILADNQKNFNVLLGEIIGKNDEALRDIQASQTTTVQVLATVAENLKAYADVAIKRSDETRLILDEIRRASSHTVLESMNSHVKITRISLDNQKQIIAMLHELIGLSRKLHERLDEMNK